jgi:hypothetical protein
MTASVRKIKGQGGTVQSTPVLWTLAAEPLEC